MLTAKQDPRIVCAIYHWLASYIEAIAEAREVWRIDTHQPSKLFIYRG